MDDPGLHDEGPLWDEVTRLRRTGRPAEGLAALEAHAAADPRCSSIRRPASCARSCVADLGDPRLAAGDVPEAVALFERAVADAPRFPDLHHRLGVARLRARRPQGRPRRVRGGRAAGRGVRRAAARTGAARGARRPSGGEPAICSSAWARRGPRRCAASSSAASPDSPRPTGRAAGEALRRAFGVDGGGVDERLRDIGARLADGRSGEALALARVLLGGASAVSRRAPRARAGAPRARGMGRLRRVVRPRARAASRATTRRASTSPRRCCAAASAARPRRSSTRCSPPSPRIRSPPRSPRRCGARRWPARGRRPLISIANLLTAGRSAR